MWLLVLRAQTVACTVSLEIVKFDTCSNLKGMARLFFFFLLSTTADSEAIYFMHS